MTTTYHHTSTTRTDADEVIRKLGELLAASAGTSRDLGTDAPAPVQENQQRWLVPLIGRLAQVVAQAAPAIIESVVDTNRDVFTEDTRDPKVQERFFGELFSALMPVVAQAAPVLGQMFGGLRAVPADDQEQQTRWLMPLLSTIVPQLVQAAPSIVQALTGGRRSAPADPAEGTRFLGALLGIAVPALVSAAPDIIELFSE